MSTDLPLSLLSLLLFFRSMLRGRWINQTRLTEREVLLIFLWSTTILLWLNLFLKGRKKNPTIHPRLAVLRQLKELEGGVHVYLLTLCSIHQKTHHVGSTCLSLSSHIPWQLPLPQPLHGLIHLICAFLRRALLSMSALTLFCLWSFVADSSLPPYTGFFLLFTPLFLHFLDAPGTLVVCHMSVLPRKVREGNLRLRGCREAWI